MADAFDYGYQQGRNHADHEAWQRGFKAGRNLTWGFALAVATIISAQIGVLIYAMWAMGC